MDLNVEIFEGKTFSSLLKDIYKNSREKEKKIRALIEQLKDMIESPGDAIIIVPLLADYLEVSVKNDDALIKMAGVVQRAMSLAKTNGDKEESFGLTDRDKELLFNDLKLLGTNVSQS
jgi:hypothetical protein